MAKETSFEEKAVPKSIIVPTLKTTMVVGFLSQSGNANCLSYEVHIGVTRQMHDFGRHWIVILCQKDSELCDWFSITGGPRLSRPYEREHLANKHFIDDSNLFVRKIHFCDFTLSEAKQFKNLFHQCEPGPNVYFLMRWFWSCAVENVLPYPYVIVLHQHGASYSRREATDNHRRRMPVDKEFVVNWEAQLEDDDYVQRLNDMFEERWCQSSADFDVLIAQLQGFGRWIGLSCGLLRLYMRIECRIRF
ncbi:hypothetical protein BDV19DRAFT_391369 [Aspergillus venezuelensis]